MKKLLTTFAAALLLSLAFTTAAFGQSSTEEGYNPEGPEVVNKVAEDDNSDSAVAPTTDSGDDDELPFTGLDLGLLGAAGGMLLVLGFGMRRLMRAPEST